MSFADIWLFLQQGVWSGLVTGSVYALLAVAVVIVFKTTDVPNFAQGEIFMVGGYVALFLILVLDWHYAVVIPATLAAVAAICALFQRVVMERVIQAKGVGVQLVIATLGLAYVLKGAVRQTGLGDAPRSLPALVSSDTVMIGDAVLTRLDLMILGAAIAAAPAPDTASLTSPIFLPTSSRPLITAISHSGRLRSSGLATSRETTSFSCCRVPGALMPTSKMCALMSNSSSSHQYG